MSGSTPPSRGRRWVKPLGIAAAVVLLVVGAVAGYLYQRAHAAPEQWQKEQARITAMDASQKRAVAERLRNRLITEWGSAEPSAEFLDTDSGSAIGQRRRFAIPYDELNVWLHVEGRSLLQALGIVLPQRVQHAMVQGTAEGNLVFAIEDDPDGGSSGGGGGGGGRVYTMTFDIDVAEDGTITSTLVSARAGRLSIPKDAATQLLTATSNTTANGGSLLNDLLTGKPVPPLDLTIDPGERGHRNGRIVGLEIDEEQIIVTRQTVRREHPDPAD